MFKKNYIGSTTIRAYESDLQTGVAPSLVARHAEIEIKRLRKIDTWAATTAADQIETWLNKLVNP